MQSSYEIFDSAIKQALKNYYNHSDYNDMYQECYMKILEVLENNTYDPVYNLYGYAYIIARNTISSYRYHSDKLTTLVAGDLPEIVPIDSGIDVETSAFIVEVIDVVFNKYQNVLPDGYKKEDLVNLLYGGLPDTLLFTVVKGDLVWTLMDSIQGC